jgi:arylsulfatase
MTKNPTREELGRRDMLLRSTAIAATAALASSTAAQPTFAQAQAQTQPHAGTGSQPQKPNVVFILADNVGYGDLGCYGGGELRGAPTPRLDQFAREGLRLTQFLVEPACTPSRAALMTGRYSIREGLSLVLVPGSVNTLSADAFTMGDMFHRLGYASAIFGKWHLGDDPRSLPTAHGFDEYYGIPPGLTWDASMYAEMITLSHAMGVPRETLVAQGPQMVEATLDGPLRNVKRFTLEVRREVDNELTDRSVDFIKRQHAAGKPFFLYLPFSTGHYPNLPTKAFAGKSRIGNYGDKLMEGDHHVGQILDTLKDLGIEENTIVIFASDNGPQGETVREIGNLATPDMGNSGPFRGELGEACEGAIRTCALVRWPGHIAANTVSYAMFSIMDFLPTLASIAGGKMPTDRPIDGVDQSDVLFGRSAAGHRESLLSFIGPELVAARWKQFRVYFSDMHPTGEGPQRIGGLASSDAPMAGYPRVYNIESDPHEDLNIVAFNGWITGQYLQTVVEYERSVKEHPNPPAPNLTRFTAGG